MMMQRARASLGEVVLHMPVAMKAAYLEALYQCPHLVETESNPDTFLLFENFNYWSAAGRLVTYWRKRWEYFGDRAFLPMDLSGDGAMSEEDLKPMASGCVTLLPDSNIIVHDRTCSSDAGDESTKLRRRFFFIHTLMGTCVRSGKGPSLCIYGFDISDVRRRMNAELRTLLADAFPIPNFEEIHVIFVKEKNQTVWQYLLPRGLEQMSGLIANVKIHNFDSVEQIADGLSCYGVTRSHLPVRLGGCYDVKFSSFVLENRLPLSTANRVMKKYNLSAFYAAFDETEPFYNDSVAMDEHETHLSIPHYQGSTEPAEGKGSFDLLLDYFLRKAPDLPDVADIDSLNPLTPFDPVLPSNLSNNSLAAQSRSVSLYLESDEAILSDYQCLVRQQIEFFEATVDDIASSVRGRNKAIVLGQVGIRCRHCAHVPRQQRAMAATYYPAKLEGIYQTCQNLARKHLISTCPYVSLECKQRLTYLCESKSATGTGKTYWAERAEMCGVCKDDAILRFEDE